MSDAEAKNLFVRIKAIFMNDKLFIITRRTNKIA